MDLIDRQAALNEIAEWMLEYGALNEKRERDALQHVARGIKKLPSAQPEEHTNERTKTHACDLISRQAAIDMAEESRSCNPHKVAEVARNHEYEHRHFIALLRSLPSVQPEPQWHECNEDDPDSFPDDDRNVLVSFSNFSLSMIGQWRVDPDGAVIGMMATQTIHFSAQICT